MRFQSSIIQSLYLIANPKQAFFIVGVRSGFHVSLTFLNLYFFKMRATKLCKISTSSTVSAVYFSYLYQSTVTLATISSCFSKLIPGFPLLCTSSTYILYITGVIVGSYPLSSTCFFKLYKAL